MSDRVEEIEAIRRRVEEIGEKDPDGGYWLELTCAKELGITYERVWIHTARDEEFVRFEKEGGKRGYNRGGFLLGEEDQPRMVSTAIGRVRIYRHRAMALAVGIMTLEQYRASTKFYVDHVEPRKTGEMPDDRPENLRVVSPSANNTNPRNKKPGPRADGRPVTLTRKATGVQTPCPSATAAAKFLGVRVGNLSKYLNREEGSRLNMPKGTGNEWEAEWTKIEGFECDDAVPIPGVQESDDRRISPTKGLLRVVGEGKYKRATNVPTMHGYLTTHVDGKDVRVHRLVFKTFKPAEFAIELAKMPPGTDESELQIDHIDGDKLNNALANLRPMDSRAHNGKHSAATRWIDEDDEVLGTYATAAEAARAVCGTDGQTLSSAAILAVCKGDCTHAGGRRFAYADADRAEELATVSAAKKRKRDEPRGRAT